MLPLAPLTPSSRFLSTLLRLTPCILLFLCSCGTLKMYPGPSRPKNEVAMIQPGGHLFRAVSIPSVDGRSLGMSNRSAEVLPGKHVVMVQLTRGNGNATRIIQREVEFVAKAGKTYTAEADQTGFWNPAFWVWIKDNTGAIVAGKKPK
ncbi:MAG: hypothetical protein ACYTGO_07455 [Planctomycetota bacterium]